jgi:putative intracellular protease/amidase
MKSRANLWQNISAIASIRESDIAAVIVPHCIGGLQDMASNDSPCANFMTSFLKLGRPICAIGFGVSALLGTTKENKRGNTVFGLSSRCVTAPSNAEISRFDYFKYITNGQIEDALRERGAKYTSAEVDSIHVIVDGALVTAQNPQSTALAIQNVIWLWKAQPSSR